MNDMSNKILYHLEVSKQIGKEEAYRTCMKICQDVTEESNYAVSWTECATEIYKRIQKLLEKKDDTRNLVS